MIWLTMVLFMFCICLLWYKSFRNINDLVQTQQTYNQEHVTYCSVRLDTYLQFNVWHVAQWALRRSGRVWTLSNVGVRKAAAGSRSLIHPKKTTQNWSSCGEIGKKGLECSPTHIFLGIVSKNLFCEKAKEKKLPENFLGGKRADFCVAARFLKSHQI